MLVSFLKSTCIKKPKIQGKKRKTLEGHMHVWTPQWYVKEQDYYIKYTQAGMDPRLKEGADWTDKVDSASESDSYFS